MARSVRGLGALLRRLLGVGVWATAVVAASVAWAAPASRADLIAAGLPADLADFGVFVSLHEGGNQGFRSINQFGCVGFSQFCPGTLQQYYSGTADQFRNDPAGQVQAFLAYQRDSWRTAQRLGVADDLIGRQICYGGECRTITSSSILMACQLGCGKLQAYIRNGYSCEGSNNAGDGNASDTACRFMFQAAGIDVSGITGMDDGGASPVEPDDGGTVPSETEGQLVTDLGDYRKCWTCQAITAASDLVTKVVAVSVGELSRIGLSLMALIVAFVLLFRIGKIMFWTGDSEGYAEVWRIMLRFAVVYVILSSASFTKDYVLGWGYEPAMRGGAELGQQAMEVSMRALGGSAPSATSCTFDMPGNDPVGAEMGRLACMVHNSAYGLVVAGAAFVSKEKSFATLKDIASGLFLLVIGVVLVLTAFMALAAFAMTVVEAVVRIGIVLSFSPALLFMYVFRQTRPIFTNGLSCLFFGFLLLVFSGVLGSVSAFVLSSALRSGMSGGGFSAQGGMVSPQEVYGWVEASIGITGFSSSTDVLALLRFVAFAIAGAMMSAHLLRAGATVAGSVAGGAGRVGEMSRGVVAAALGGAISTIAIPTVGALGLGGFLAGRTVRAAGAAVGAIATTGAKAAIGGAGRIFDGAGGQGSRGGGAGD